MKRLPFFLAILFALFWSLSVPSVQALFTPSPSVVQDLVAESLAKPEPEPTVYRDLVYRRSVFRSHQLDIYEPTVDYERGSAPVVVFLHGGSWIQGDKATIRVVDRFLSRMRETGYFVAAVNYTTSLLRGLVGPLDNVRAAIRWLGARAPEYGYDPHRMGLYGVSAGGHLALMAASTMAGSHTADPDRGFDFSFIFAECAPTDLIGMRDGDAFENSSVFRVFPERRLRSLSPITFAERDLPPILIFHGGQDRTVHIDQSERYVAAVTGAGGDAELVRYPDGDHAFLNLSRATWYAQETRALRFFARHF